MNGISYRGHCLGAFQTFFLVGTLLYGSSLWAQNTDRGVSIVGKSVQPKVKTLVEEKQDTAVFRFIPKREMFLEDYKENDTNIDWFTRSIRQCKSSIESGEMKVRVLGFCSSYDSNKDNLAAAKNRSNQVKSYFILREGLKEEYFQTKNSTLQQWHGMSDIVVVTYLRQNERTTTTPEKEWKSDAVSNEPSLNDEQKPQSESDAVKSSDEHRTTVESNPVEAHSESDEILAKPSANPLYSRWAIKSNVAYLLATVANIGAEYGFADHYSLDLSVIYSPYTVARDYRLRFLGVQPEFRYWLDTPMKGHFFGAHLNIGAFNIAVDKEKRYQSPDGFYGAGISYGYTLPFARHWAAEFTAGLGYVFTKFDTYYNIPNGACFEKGTPYNYWGLTKVGVSLVYRFGK